MSFEKSSDIREKCNSLDKSDNLLVFWGLVFLLFVIWFLSPFIMYGIKLFTGFEGSISYESINSLFSGWAFAGVIYTIILQRKELALQREELYKSRIEYEKQSSIMEEQMKSLQEESVLNKKNNDYNRYYDFVQCEPIFIYDTEKNSTGSTRYNFFNVGRTIYFVEMKAKSPNSSDYYANEKQQILKNKSVMSFELNNFYTNVETIVLEITYRNQIGYANTKVLHLSLEDGKIVEVTNSYEKLFNIPELVENKEITKSKVKPSRKNGYPK